MTTGRINQVATLFSSRLDQHCNLIGSASAFLVSQIRASTRGVLDRFCHSWQEARMPASL